MPNPEETSLAHAQAALGLLSESERADAADLIALCERLFLAPEDASLTDRTRLLRLIEVLARRSANAMPFAALGRALSARLSGDERSVALLLREFQTKLQMLGL